MTSGYIYCFSNESMPGVVKVGMTIRTPFERLSEANSSDTWRPPTQYKLEFAKKVTNSKQKKNTLHKLLSKYTERINPKREFFHASPREVETFFELIDGVFYFIDECEESSNEKPLMVSQSIHPHTRSRTYEELYWYE
jgi:hypothetical protein